jgi:hypothetical protein
MVAVRSVYRNGLVLLALAAAGLSVGACAGGGPGPEPQADPPPPNPAASGAAAPPTHTSTQSKELTLVNAVRPSISNTVAALEKGDMSGARTAWATYDPLWNGIEVYINYRSLPIYQDLENNWQARINTALATPDAKAADVLPLAQSLLAKWDEAVKLVETGPAITPLFDDVADIRIARQPLRQVPAALTANDLTKAKALFTAFTENWAKVNGLFRVRSAEAYTETEAAIAAVNSAWAKASPTAAQLTPLVAVVSNRYGYGQNLVTTAARKADLSKTTFSNEDVQAAGGVRGIQAELQASMTAWSAGIYTEAAARSDKASKILFASDTVATPLKAKALDAALKIALDNYAAVASAAGDSAKVSTANKAALEACEIAIQGLVGQFWSDPKLASAVASATPK